jgi:two-component system phosphate regulon response regulator PhoB
MSEQLSISIGEWKRMEPSDMTTVIVIEDEPNVRKLVIVNLISRGYAVLEAANAPQALDLLRTATPDLMILDIKLPEMTGWELLAQIAADPSITRNFPVLAMTASIMEAQVDRQRYPNVVDVLLKPFSATRLMTAIERALHPPASR